MTADCLIDTNVLVYAVDSSPANIRKKEVAMTLIETADFGLSAQVLQEFYVTVTRKLEVPLSPEVALAFLDRFHVFPMVVTDFGIITEGIRNSVKFQISYWDGAIIAAAERLKANTLYSEDLNHDQHYGAVRTVNPFIA
ncbi:MAG: PIN domain-containing protein [Verrucomicrobia bacterium]|nr:PIN domain-containing protein [Verrucomicrobiota bacterium]